MSILTQVLIKSIEILEREQEKLRNENARLKRSLDVANKAIERHVTFTINRKLDKAEIEDIRRWYKGALLREQDGLDPDGFAKEAIEKMALFLGGAESLEEREKAQ